MRISAYLGVARASFASMIFSSLVEEEEDIDAQ